MVLLVRLIIIFLKFGSFWNLVVPTSQNLGGNLFFLAAFLGKLEPSYEIGTVSAAILEGFASKMAAAESFL